MAEIWGAAIAVGGTLVGAAVQKQGANKAAAAGQAGTDAAIAEQRRQFDLSRLDTAPYRNVGAGALALLGSPYGLSTGAPAGGGSGGYANNFLETTAGAAPVNGFAPPAGGTFDKGAGALVNPYTISSKLGDARYVLDPAGKLFGNILGSKHGDENRNLKAFAAESGVQQLPDGRLALPDGTVFNQDQLQQVAGTWYGAKYAPDGDQTGWQQKYTALTSGMKPNGPQGGDLNAVQGADGSFHVPESSGYAPTPGGGIDQRVHAFADPSGAAPGTGGQPVPPGSPDFSNFFASPDFLFRQQEGDKAITRNASALGGLASGNTGAALVGRSSDLAAGEYGNYFNRLSTLAGLGNSAVNTATNAGVQTASNIGNAAIAGANTRASGIAAGTDAYGNALGTIAGIGYNYFNQPKRPIGTGGYGTQSYNTYGSPQYGRAA